MTRTSPEIAFYRAVEDLFAQLRGRPHTLSPKDFQLLRTWWKEGVPFAAVAGGITEVFAKKRDRGDDDPVVSLSYCRHAVKRHARLLAAMRAGSGDSQRADAASVAEELARLAGQLDAAAEHLAADRPAVAEAVAACRRQLAAAAPATEAEAETLLFALEETLLESCLAALEPQERAAVEAVARAAAGAAGDEDARRRIFAARRDQELRRRLGLPRLELT